MAEGRIRIDKWLWAARFFKTRSLASEAVAGGRVHIEGQRVKPARDVRLGEQVQITVGDVTTTVVVEALSDRRGPASQAVLLYRETGESRERRERERELRRLAPPPGADMRGPARQARPPPPRGAARRHAARRRPARPRRPTPEEG